MVLNKDVMPEKSWVVAKSNGKKRYVSRYISETYFEDDGQISGQSASPYCNYQNYLPLNEFTEV